jgi:hypothetical protein
MRCISFGAGWSCSSVSALVKGRAYYHVLDLPVPSSDAFYLTEESSRQHSEWIPVQLRSRVTYLLLAVSFSAAYIGIA